MALLSTNHSTVSSKDLNIDLHKFARLDFEEISETDDFSDEKISFPCVIPTNHNYILAFKPGQNSTSSFELNYFKSDFPNNTKNRVLKTPKVYFKSLDQLKKYTTNQPNHLDILYLVFQDNIAIELDSINIPGVKGKIFAYLVYNSFGQKIIQKSDLPIVGKDLSLNQFSSFFLNPKAIQNNPQVNLNNSSKNNQNEDLATNKITLFKSKSSQLGVGPTQISISKNIITIKELGQVKANEFLSVLPWSKVVEDLQKPKTLSKKLLIAPSQSIIPPFSVILGTTESLNQFIQFSQNNFDATNQETLEFISIGSQTNYAQILCNIQKNIACGFQKQHEMNYLNTYFLDFPIHCYWSRVLAQEINKYGMFLVNQPSDLTSNFDTYFRYFNRLKNNLT